MMHGPGVPPQDPTQTPTMANSPFYMTDRSLVEVMKMTVMMTVMMKNSTALKIETSEIMKMAPSVGGKSGSGAEIACGLFTPPLTIIGVVVTTKLSKHAQNVYSSANYQT